MVATLLVVTGTASAGLVGFVAGVALQWTPTPSVGVLLGIMAGAVVLDVVKVRTGRPAPIAVGRQVPIEWGRMFDPRVVAVLYGARLGVGPMTILSTWLWWATTIGAALVGVGTSVVVAAVFGLVRMLVTVAASQRADATDHASWFGRLRQANLRAWLSLDGLTVVLLAVVFVAAACTTDATVDAGPDTSGTTADDSNSENDEDTPVNDDGTNDDVSTDDTTTGDAEDGGAATPTTQGLTESSLAQTTAPLVTSPDDIEPRPPAEPSELAASLLAEVPDFVAIDDPAADRALSIDQAAALQPDPTEELPLLETRGFQGGWTRAFRNDDNDVVVLTVYDFVSTLEAEFYLEDGTITLIGDGATIYEVGSIPGGRGFRSEIVDGGETLVVFGITFTRNNQWFLVTIVGAPETATAERVLSVAEEQAESVSNQ